MNTSKRLFALQAALAVVLLFLVAVFASRVVERLQGVRIRLGGSEPVGLKASTRAFLSALRGRVTLTYFVTSRGAMPSSMKGVEDAVTRMLRAWKEAAPEQVDYRVIDPDMPDDVELFLSESSLMPPKLNGVEKELRGALEELGMRLNVRVIHPERLPTAAQDELRAAGIRELDVHYDVQGVQKTARVWSAMRISRDRKSEVEPKIDAQWAQELKSRLAAFVNRLSPKQAAAYASSKAVSPVKLRQVVQDESSEAVVWSSLAIAHDRNQDGFVQGILPGDLPYLEDLVVETLRASGSTVQPVVAISAPARGYASVREFCTSLGGARVTALDLDKDPRVPHDSDLLLWIDPRTASRDHALELERYLATGRSAIVAGSTYTVDYLARDAGKLGYRIAQSGADWGAFLRPFGLSLRPALVSDKNHEAITWQRDGSPIKVDAPFQLRIFPTLFDTRSLLGPNAGALLVSSVSPIGWDPKAVAACGRRVEVIATTSEHARLNDLPETEFDDALFADAEPVPKQPWMVLLKPKDPWKGDLILVGSPVLFHDDPYAQGGNANQTFLRTLLRTYSAPPRLARIRVPRYEPPRVPALSAFSRVAWRVVIVLLVPAFLMVLALRRARSRPLGPRRLPWVKPLAAGAAGLVLVLLLSRILGGLRLPRIDATEDSINTPSPLSTRLLDGVRAGLDVELLVSEGFRMPPELKRTEQRLLAGLRGLGLRPRITRPEDLSAADQKQLRASGIQPFDVDYVLSDAPASARVWSAMRVSLGPKSEVVPRIDARSIEHLEFLLAAAVKRLLDGRTPVLGVLSDLPRLTPGEAHSDYQQKGYTAPVGSDVYSLAKRLLESYGYEVAYINPEAPVYPEKMDVLVWLQPRFPQRSYTQLTKFMAEGGKAVIAIQHYNVQQRQYRGAGFKTVYWPQPQFHSFNDFLKLLGVDQLGDKRGESPGEVLFDRQHADLVLETQVNRSAFREHDPQQVSRPFLIRAAGDGLSQRSVVTSRLGGLLFIWGSRFQLDEARIAQLGLSREILVTTSPRAWTYNWVGSWIPEESFTEPAQFLPGPQPLAVLLEGRFPRMEVKKDEQGRESLSVVEGAGAAGSPGKMLLIGCSEMFKNAHLQAAGYQHDQLLLNAVALLAHGPELAEIQARTKAPKVVPYQPGEVRIAWWGIVLGSAPAVFILYGLLRLLWRRRPILKGSAV